MSFSFNGFFGAVPGLSKEARLSVTGAGSTTVNKWVNRVCTVGHECNIAEGHNDGKRSGCRNPIRQEDLKYYKQMAKLSDYNLRKKPQLYQMYTRPVQKNCQNWGENLI